MKLSAIAVLCLASLAFAVENDEDRHSAFSFLRRLPSERWYYSPPPPAPRPTPHPPRPTYRPPTHKPPTYKPPTYKPPTNKAGLSNTKCPSAITRTQPNAGVLNGKCLRGGACQTRYEANPMLIGNDILSVKGAQAAYLQSLGLINYMPYGVNMIFYEKIFDGFCGDPLGPTDPNTGASCTDPKNCTSGSGFCCLANDGMGQICCAKGFGCDGGNTMEGGNTFCASLADNPLTTVIEYNAQTRVDSGTVAAAIPDRDPCGKPEDRKAFQCASGYCCADDSFNGNRVCCNDGEGCGFGGTQGWGTGKRDCNNNPNPNTRFLEDVVEAVESKEEEEAKQEIEEVVKEDETRELWMYGGTPPPVPSPILSGFDCFVNICLNQGAQSFHFQFHLNRIPYQKEFVQLCKCILTGGIDCDNACGCRSSGSADPPLPGQIPFCDCYCACCHE